MSDKKGRRTRALIQKIQWDIKLLLSIRPFASNLNESESIDRGIGDLNNLGSNLEKRLLQLRERRKLR